jgi:hypothetical protein
MFNFTQVKTILSTLSVALAILLFLFSCQKEIHFDLISEGELVRDASNNCKPVIVNGSFISGNDLDINNHIGVEVHFTAIGSYTIATDTVNGYSFKAEGNTSDTGFVNIQLSGNGKPIHAGSDQFHIAYGNSTCTASVTVLDATSLASFTLQGSPNSCIIDTVIGGYIKGVAADTSSHVIIAVNVTTPGTYSVKTNTVNGYAFSGAGNFSATGVQTISLVASGTPVNGGTDVFTLKAGSSTCTFSVNVLTATVATNNDLFPLTMSSFWNYDDLYYKGTTVKRVIIDTATRNGNLYTLMQEQSTGAPIVHFYRRNGLEYYEYMAIDDYTSSVHYGKRIYDDILFLKEGLKKGDTWQTKEFSDTADFGQVIVLQYRFACVASDISAVVGAKAFSHVYEIEMQTWLRTPIGPYGQANEKYTWYYAKGVGLIYYKKLSVGFTYGEWRINNWQVN